MTSSTSRLELLQATVAAKVAYWDALLALENDCTAHEGFTDAHNDQVTDYIADLAAGIDTVAEVPDAITEEILQGLNKVLGQD